jgi:hypothetical protein
MLSPTPADAILETVSVILMGMLVSLWSWTLARGNRSSVSTTEVSAEVTLIFSLDKENNELKLVAYEGVSD